jgi:thioredoxin reductase (NADPH)
MEILTPEMKKDLKANFAVLKSPVTVMVFTKEGVNEQFNQIATDLVREISGVEPRVRADFRRVGDEASVKYGVKRSPTLLIDPDKYSIRFTGAPLGEEGRTLVMALLMASTGQPALTGDSIKRLARLRDKRHTRVFVSPTCPYCPQQSSYAIAAAVARRDLVSAEIIEIYENRDLAEKYAAMSVPKTFVGETNTSQGLEQEEYFVESLVLGRKAEYVMPVDREELRDYDIVIIGGGPAGLSAAIYAERSGLKSIVFEKAALGGQIAITPVVENYTGFPQIAGKTLVELMARHAMEYAPVLQGVGVDSVKKAKKGFEAATKRGVYSARALIIATGAANRKLNANGEDRLTGRGVSYCSTCDGYLYRDGREVMVVGGGNTALTDALYLDSLGARVTLLHRGDSLRAEDRLQKSLSGRNIKVLLNSRVAEILGGNSVEKILIEDVKTGRKKEVRASGVFIAIGYEPSSRLAQSLGLELDAGGYIKTDAGQRTSMPGVYAAGDITGGVKQITVAVGQGSVAAITAFEDLTQRQVRAPLRPGKGAVSK